MKNSTALRQSQSSVRFLTIAVPVMWGLFVWSRWWQLAAVAVFMSLYLAMDLYTIRNIKKAVAKDPDFLKKKVAGT